MGETADQPSSIGKLFKPDTWRNIKFQRYLLLFGVSALLSILLTPRVTFFRDNYRPGDIASNDIKVAEDTLIVDEEGTARKRVEEVKKVKAIYDFDWRLSTEVTGRLHDSFEIMRERFLQIYPHEIEQQFDELGNTLKKVDPEKPEITAEELNQKLAELKKELDDALRVSISENDFQTLLDLRFSIGVEEKIMRLLRPITQQKIVSNLELLEAEKEKGIVIKKIQLAQTAKDPERSAISSEVVENFEPSDISSIIELETARTQIEVSAKETFVDADPKLKSALVSLAQKLLSPNLTFNKQATEEEKTNIGEAVKPVLFQLKKGEIIVRAGERITAGDIPKISELLKKRESYSWFWFFIGMFLMSILVIAASHHFAASGIKKYTPTNKDFLFLGSMIIFTALSNRAALFVAEALAANIPYIQFSSYLFGIAFIPLATVMVVRMVLNSESAFVYSILVSIMVGIQLDNQLRMAIFSFAGAMVAADGVAHCTQRTKIFKAGLKAAAFGIMMVAAFNLFEKQLFTTKFLYDAGLSLFGGLSAAILATGLAPLVEMTYGYLTDIKLLELSNLDQPLLKQLIMHAPGTYHHSMIIGTMVEEAAKAIGANPLLARVGGYYHDIGKTVKPQYFIENQDAKNPHDKIKPQMSARIIRRHVIDGVRMAREQNLPRQLVDFIPQHHGNMMIGAFYDQAVKLADPESGEISEEDFRYPGPKPQHRETALVMLADGIEASSRVLPDPTPARIQGMIQKRINAIFAAGQLEECALTLRDLHHITKSFTHVLSSLFHHRVDYVEPVGKESNGKKKTDVGPDKQSEQTDTGDKPDPGESTESLKRLGLRDG